MSWALLFSKDTKKATTKQQSQFLKKRQLLTKLHKQIVMTFIPQTAIIQWYLLLWFAPGMTDPSPVV